MKVLVAKGQTYDDLYSRLDTKAGEIDLYMLVRQRDGDEMDVEQTRVMKDRDGG